MQAICWAVAAVTLAAVVAGGPTVKMKVISAPPPTAHPTIGKINRDNVNYKLHPRVPHSDFAGPPALRSLYGQCFPDVIGDYEWRVCPFDNVTQHQVNSGAWNSFNGIIGVWKSYDVENDTLSHLTFEHGDDCSNSHQRSARVRIICGEKNQTLSASEPAPCKYEMVLETPLACNGSLSLPNILDNTTLRQVRVHDREFDDGELTAEGHRIRILRTLKAAGVLPGERTTTAITTTVSTPTAAPSDLTPTAPHHHEYSRWSKWYNQIPTAHDSPPPSSLPPSPPPPPTINVTAQLEACDSENAALRIRVSELETLSTKLQRRLDSIFSLSGNSHDTQKLSTSVEAGNGRSVVNQKKTRVAKSSKRSTKNALKDATRGAKVTDAHPTPNMSSSSRHSEVNSIKLSSSKVNEKRNRRHSKTVKHSAIRERASDTHHRQLSGYQSSTLHKNVIPKKVSKRKQRRKRKAVKRAVPKTSSDTVAKQVTTQTAKVPKQRKSSRKTISKSTSKSPVTKKKDGAQATLRDVSKRTSRKRSSLAGTNHKLSTGKQTLSSTKISQHRQTKPDKSGKKTGKKTGTPPDKSKKKHSAQ